MQDLSVKMYVYVFCVSHGIRKTVPNVCSSLLLISREYSNGRFITVTFKKRRIPVSRDFSSYAAICNVPVAKMISVH